MASSDNLPTLEPWAFRTSFPESWISEAYARDTQTLTKALHKTLSTNSVSETLASDSFNPFLSLIHPETAPPAPTASNLSGSDPETGAAASKSQRSALPGATGKVSKRKSRASKRSQTTFITADPANFRQMVQQVTGVRFGNSQLPVVPVLKPEAQRPGSRLQGSAAGCLPTLDTSAFLLDHQQQQVVLGSTSEAGPIVGAGPLSFPQPVMADGGGGLDFEPFPSFPTLESWKVL